MPFFNICSATFSIVIPSPPSSPSYISFMSFFSFSFESAYRPSNGVITFVKLSLFILSSKVRACPYFFLPYINNIMNLIDGQNKESCNFFAYSNNLFLMLAFFIKPCNVFDHFSHSIPKYPINLDKLYSLLAMRDRKS